MDHDDEAFTIEIDSDTKEEWELRTQLGIAHKFLVIAGDLVEEAADNLKADCFADKRRRIREFAESIRVACGTLRELEH